MSLLDDLIDAQKSSAVAHLEFMIQNKRNIFSLHAFFEGQDDESFYTHTLHHHLPKDWRLHIYRCGNKDAVYDAFNMTNHAALPGNLTLYFVDKDHSDILPNKNPTSPFIFVTEYYSIENHSVNADTLKRLLREIYHIDNEKTIGRLQTAFEAALEQFHRLMLPLMAISVWFRRKGFGVAFDNFDPGKSFIFDSSLKLTRRARRRGSPTISQYFVKCLGPNARPPSIGAICKTVRQISVHHPKCLIRGKYELWFFVRFLDKARELLDSAGGGYSIHQQVALPSAMELLGPRTPPPLKLRDFIANHINSTIIAQQHTYSNAKVGPAASF